MRATPPIFWIWLCVALGMAGQATPVSGQLTNIAQCLDSVRNRVDPIVPLRLEAVVTLVDKEHRLVVLQDDSAPIALQLPSSIAFPSVGQRVLVQGDGVLPYIRAFPDFPDQPTGRTFLNSFEVPSNVGPYYLARIRGFLYPPETGSYRFWIAADDAGEFWLSPDSDPEKIQKTAALGIGNSTGSREWTRYPTQGSQPVELRAGEKYYVETYHIQGVGRDSLAVAWEGPGMNRSVIDAHYLTPWKGRDIPAEIVAEAPAHGLLREYWTNFYVRDFSTLQTRNRTESAIRVPGLNLTVLGEAVLPMPRRIRQDAPFATATNFEWVECTGDVVFAGGVGDKLRIEMEWGDSVVGVRVLNWNGQSTGPLMNSQIRVRGVMVHTYGRNREPANSVIWVPGHRQVTVVAQSAGETANVERVQISEIEPSNPQMNWGRRLRVRGRIVSVASNGVAELQGNDKFQAYSSADGSHWVPIAKPVEIGMSNSVEIGLALASHHTQERARATFDHLDGCGTNWLCTDIGRSAVHGEFAADRKTVTVHGSGSQIWRTADQHFFVYQTLVGEGEITARLSDFKPDDPHAETGLIIRESLDRRAPCAALLYAPVYGLRFRCRRLADEYPVDFMPEPAYRNQQWMKLTRKRNRLTIQLEPGWQVDTNREMDVTGTLNWRDDTPVLVETCLQKVPSNFPAAQAVRRNLPRGISIDDYVTEAQRSSQPYLRGFLEASGMRGIVTFCDQVSGQPVLFVHGSDVGIYIAWPDTNVVPDFEAGQMVEFAGRSVVGRYPITLNPSTIKVFGWGTLPEPVAFSADMAAGGSGQGKWVVTEGIIRSTRPEGTLNLMSEEGPIAIWIGHDGTNNLKKYIDTRVRVRGVLSLGTERDALVLVPSAEFVEVEETAPPDPFIIPGFSIARLSGINVRPEQLHRIKVSGVVTCTLKNGLYVQDDTGGVYIQTLERPSVNIGDRVEAVGFPIRATAVLADALVKRVEDGTMPSAIPITSEQIVQDRMGPVLVRSEAVLVEQQDNWDSQVLILQDGPRIVRASLPVSAKSGAGLPALPQGSRVAVTGVYRSQLRNNDVLEPVDDGGDQSLGAAYQLWLRTPADVVLLQRPPWWTWRKALFAVLIAGMGLLGALVWVRALRRKVALRTCELQETMNQLRRETHTSAVLAERNRLAREIHDSLEQGLTAILLQLDAVGKFWHKPEEARKYLGLARNMAEFSRVDVQHAVRDLHSPMLEDADLGAALTQLAGTIGTGEDQQIAVTVSGTTSPLPTAVQHHLLRIGQEAITNAIKHARPQRIQVRVDYSQNQLQLSVQDDGCGFVPGEVPRSAREGHFGLEGMRARAQSINAAVDISSETGKGTRVTVTLPLNGHHQGGT